MRPVFSREASSVCAPKNFIRDVSALPLLEGQIDRAFLEGVKTPIRSGVVHQCMHVLPQEFCIATVTQQAETGSITEGAGSIYVNGINGLCRGIEEQLQLLFAGPNICFGTPLCSDVVGQDELSLNLPKN